MLTAIRLLTPWLATVAGTAVLEQATPGTQLDLTSLLVQVPLVFLVVWIISSRDKQWREIMEKRDEQWRTMITERDTQWQVRITERDEQWRTAIMENDKQWRDAMAEAHQQGIEQVSKKLDVLIDTGNDNTKLLVGNATRLQTLVQKARPGQ